MYKFFFFLFCISCTGALRAQKKPIDHSVYGTWPEVSYVKISNDGKYVLYLTGSSKSGTTLSIQATDNSWKKEFPGVQSGIITEDSWRMIFAQGRDSIGIQELGKDNFQYIPAAGAY